MEIATVCLTSILSYLVLFVLARIMGNKQISQLDSFDYITGITIGSSAAEFATNLEDPWKPFTAMVIYAIATLLLGFITRKIPRTRKFISGSSFVLLDRGKINRKNMKKAKIEIDEFLVMCREQGYFDLQSIETALFESNGKLSILPVSTRRPVTPEDMQLAPAQEMLFTEVIMDGEIMDQNLKNLGLDPVWLAKQLKAQGFGSAKEVFLGVCDRNRNIQFYKNG